MPNLEESTAAKKSGHSIRKQGTVHEQELSRFLTRNGQGLLPMVALIEQSPMVPAFLRTEKNFRRIMGSRELWTLETILIPSQYATQKAVA